MDYEELLQTTFCELDKSRFQIQDVIPLVFVCGGIINAAAPTPPSFRDRFLSYTATGKFTHIHDSIILAESFKDYFKDGAYRDLLEFEDDIASLSPVIVIFLESPGSFVELGLFSGRQSLYKKMLIVVPDDKVQDEDSFIFLGPVSCIKRKDSSSIAIYPWPDSSEVSYNADNLIDLCEIVEEKMINSQGGGKFDENNAGHITLLIAEIIRLSYPILINEIKAILTTIGINAGLAKVSQLIYLLTSFNVIGKKYYSGHDYYYPINTGKRFIAWGPLTTGKSFDEMKLYTSASKLMMEDNPSSRKRKNAKLAIMKIIQDKSE